MSLDLARFRQALLRGWVTAGQVGTAVNSKNEDGSLLAAAARQGLLDDSQIRRLQTATLDLDTPISAIEPVVDDTAVLFGPGRIIGARYRSDALLQGGFGLVVLATDMMTGRKVALKTLRRDCLGERELVELFRLEVVKWLGLGAHPNLVHAYGLGEYLRLPFVVMEYVDGGSLRDVVERGSDWRTALHIGLQVARGLAYARTTSQLVHRDLKPENVLVTRDGEAKVTDFGIALVLRRRSGTERFLRIGTPPYMAPEQWRAPDSVDVRADIYAFGVMLFELAAGARPFPDHSDMESYQIEHEHTPSPDVRSIRSDVPAAVAALITRCLEKRPAARPDDFSEVLDEIGAVRRAQGLHASVADALPPLPSRVEALVNQSQAYQTLALWDEALEAAERAVALAPDEWTALNALGNAWRLLRRWPEAIEALARARRLAPENLPPIVNLALTHLDAGDHERARAYLAEAVVLAQKTGTVGDLENASWVAVEVEPPARALALCAAILGSNPLSVQTLNNQAVLLRRVGRLEEALSTIEGVLQLNPRHAAALSNRATVLDQLGRFPEALRAADAAIVEDPQRAGAWIAKIIALGELGRLDEARACRTEALAHFPNHPALLHNLK